MNNEKIAIIMAQHGFTTKVVGNNIFGYIPYTSPTGDGEEVTNITGYSIKQLKDYLGY